MPQLACNPILINLTGLTPNTWIQAVLNVKSEHNNKNPVNVNFTLNLRTDADGKVNNFDISPLVAGVCRQYFDGGQMVVYNGFASGPGEYYYTVKINNVQKKADTVLFGAGEVDEDYLTNKYILRRNTSAIHAYKGLPGSFSTYGRMKMKVFSETFSLITSINNHSGGIVVCSIEDQSIPVGKYYIVNEDSLRQTVWDDTMIWTDADKWEEEVLVDVNDAVIYPLHIHPSPADCIRGGAQIYVRYWNSRGAWSYALLDVQYNDLQAKTTYADSWRLDATPVNGRIFGDRVQTDKEMTYSITAGRDGLDRLDVDELRDMQRSYCVQVWDIDKEVWRDCYVKDATTRNAGGRAQEMTFTIEMPHEYTFTR